MRLGLLVLFVCLVSQVWCKIWDDFFAPRDYSMDGIGWVDGSYMVVLSTCLLVCSTCLFPVGDTL